MNPSTEPVQPGHLYVVATPIGNLGDLSPRALAVLGAVDGICAEDTRTSGALLGHFGVKKPLTALHDHNEEQAAAGLVAKLRAGQSLALVSDAGTPLISDPGFRLVRAVREAGLPVLALPGPCAAIAALSISGLPSDRFLFIGFLPAKQGPRRAALQELARETATLVIYESSHRIADCIDDLAVVLGEQRRVCVARELTKLFEESQVAAAGALRGWLRETAHREKGEFVLVVEGAPKQDTASSADAERILRVLTRELGASQAARLTAEITGMKKRDLYELAVGLGGRQEPEAEE
ncbi:MAG TPA: 16S rRNA (cytidine(1402)-2'-O)-methyltransferase [Solimonas sp.]|nr:16S rRNA (cytidine(1402)-2'-O)-methyltransferase [Solimonas sp.]